MPRFLQNWQHYYESLAVCCGSHPQHFGKKDPQQKQKQDPEPHHIQKRIRIFMQVVQVVADLHHLIEDPDPHQSKRSDPDPHESEKVDPDPYQGDADPQH
jgi:hypothetical protein